MAVAHKSAISISYFYIPVEFHKATRDISISFNQLCKESHERIRYKKYCPSCDKEVTNDDIIKGYEYEKGKYVTFTQDEIEKLKTQNDKTIKIEHFAKMTEINPIYFQKDYFLVPDPGATKSYELLRRSLLSMKRVAIARTVIGTNEELLALYPTKECLVAKVLFYQEEIQEIPKSFTNVELTKKDLELGKEFIEAYSRQFDISAYHDEFQIRLREAIQEKISGNEIVSPKEEMSNNIIPFDSAGIERALKLAKQQHHTDRGTA